MSAHVIVASQFRLHVERCAGADHAQREGSSFNSLFFLLLRSFSATHGIDGEGKAL